MCYFILFITFFYLTFLFKNQYFFIIYQNSFLKYTAHYLKKKKASLLLKHPLAIHEAQNQRFTTENENGKKPSILILRLGEEGR